MKKIGDDAIPIVLPLSKGQWWNLGEEQRKRLASWVVLFNMSYEFKHKPTVCVSERERFAFRESGGSVSSNWRLAIGLVRPRPGSDPALHRAMELLRHIKWDGHRRAQTTCFAFGQLLCLSLYGEYPYRFDFETFARSRGLHPLWPLTQDRIAAPILIHSDHSVITLVKEFFATLEVDFAGQ